MRVGEEDQRLLRLLTAQGAQVGVEVLRLVSILAHSQVYRVGCILFAQSRQYDRTHARMQSCE